MLVRKKDTQTTFAMKILKKDMIELRNQKIHTKTEREVLEKIKNPFIVQLCYAFQTPEKLYLVMEYMPGGELFFHLRKEKKFTEDRAIFYASEIILALECLHKNGIIYRDLKPENVLLTASGHLKITDFGLSKQGMAFGKGKAYTFCGTPEYLAPEIIKGEGYDKAVDWWSFGALIYEMLAGRPPFSSKPNRPTMLKNIMTKPAEMLPIFSNNAKDLLSKLLKINPKDRLGTTLRDSEEIKEHPFFSKIDWIKVYAKEIEPPFRPPISGQTDITNFDKQFTKEPVDEDPPQEKEEKAPENKDPAYDGFTYAPEVLALKKASIDFT